ncbi:hypothetical protein Nepgr_007878 [Nepenthes gracilis]|uniref:Uncharacterized protein n=1 Tax=Nepenthes gracilis TaxID=150966 RepID=A0AAD3S7U3_NEPGR|nr:hypothetical protein Nepgr_007878 [Nepenthes gracilis]
MGLPPGSSRPPPSLSGVALPPFGSMAPPFLLLQEVVVSSTHGPDASFLDSMKPLGCRHCHMAACDNLDSLGPVVLPDGTAHALDAAPTPSASAQISQPLTFGALKKPQIERANDLRPLISYSKVIASVASGVVQCEDVAIPGSVPTPLQVSPGGAPSMPPSSWVDKWRPMQVKGRSANQKSTRKSAHQDAILTISIPADSSAGDGAPSSLGVHEKEAAAANHDVPLKKALHADLAGEVLVNNVDINDSPNSFAAFQIPEDSAEMEVDATECKSSIGMGDDELKAHPSVKRSDLNLKAAVDCVYNNFDAEGYNSELEFSDSAALSSADSDAHCCPSGSLLINGTCSIAYVDMVRRGHKSHWYVLPMICCPLGCDVFGPWCVIWFTRDAVINPFLIGLEAALDVCRGLGSEVIAAGLLRQQDVCYLLTVIAEVGCFFLILILSWPRSFLPFFRDGPLPCAAGTKFEKLADTSNQNLLPVSRWRWSDRVDAYCQCA